jgi:hypothetical protein
MAPTSQGVEKLKDFPRRRAAPPVLGVIVSNALQPATRVDCNVRLAERTNHPRAPMLASLTAEGRLFGFDPTEWAMLLGGSALVGLVTLLTT